jgi:hypothetical protein
MIRSFQTQRKTRDEDDDKHLLLTSILRTARLASFRRPAIRRSDTGSRQLIIGRIGRRPDQGIRMGGMERMLVVRRISGCPHERVWVRGLERWS